ncbi:RecQ family ATP-dependent DNA helicase [Sphingobacterium faecium]|uniref:RecQ family ATP-dependent DNA helicase n=1 Tax=Sphingobacterium faecium TaxID=34087 RepID=UPI0005F28734|nr:RecQ family ATP-dependent DNA helicase [Sphingobacterium faecium]UXD68354.1 RecQ family ATP-dependent DNA helicase [Sphingobacterium faecium]WGQ16057.1 RecQ family ATP-dependent DNA helicase [Sphingobacterium faecium]SJN50568.1 ATP-dependent DNA helicase, RecQ family [Sphingobacterium faecium PCAi_F2.5]HCU46545.1 RecQ family ATP-dependent DNA helicase [Sphingobacterium sp.]
MSLDSISILKQYWGHDSFRPLQEEIIQSVLEKRDTLALLPTGGGKSICFQIPAMMLPGICIVVTPLIALMKDQVQHLKDIGIQAVAIYSGLKPREVDIILDNCIFGQIKFLYLSPERLYSELVQERIKHMPVNLFAIDEAHCISQWGYDFRPPYLQLGKLKELHSDVPFLALTATATTAVIADIQDKLQFKQNNVFVKSFLRDNLGYMALEEENKAGRMIRIIQKLGGSGVVYVRNRRETQEVARYLVNNGISADFYHAGLLGKERDSKQEAWMQNRTRVIVATNAFGMGIDKPDVRFVIHLDIPESLEAYYQEAGRAGRDGKKAFPVLLYQQGDKDRLLKNVKLSFPSVAFIQQVYHHLCNHFQIPYGAGEGLTFDFDVVAFIKKYKIETIPTLSALKFLEKDGWLAVSEAVFIPSRFKFEVNHQELYKIQVQYERYDKLIKAILRSYGGVFDDYITINEYEFAKKLGVSYEQIVSLIHALVQMEIASYIPPTDAPQLSFLQDRVDYKNLYVDHVFIRERQQVKITQVEAMLNYIEHSPCRSQSLLQYFGEQNTLFCQVCDLCLIRNHKVMMHRNIKLEIERILLRKPQTIQDLIGQISIGDDEIKLDVVRSLIDSHKIRIVEDLYFWNMKI